jgi:hypothetical protein
LLELGSWLILRIAELYLQFRVEKKNVSTARAKTFLQASIAETCFQSPHASCAH